MKIPHRVVGRTNRPNTETAPIQAANPNMPSIGTALVNAGAQFTAAHQLITERREKQERFQALKAYNDFEATQVNNLMRAKRDTTVDSELPSSFNEQYEQDFSTFLETIPKHARNDIELRGGALMHRLNSSAMEYHLNLQDETWRNGVNDRIEQGRDNLATVATIEGLEAERTRTIELIEASGLSEAEKNKLIRDASTVYETAVYRNMVQAEIRQNNPDGPGSGARTAAAETILEYANPDLTGSLDQLMYEERLDATVDTVTEVEKELAAQLGFDVWGNLPDAERTALMVIAATSGDLPEELIEATLTGDPELIADEIETLKAPWAEDFAEQIREPDYAADQGGNFLNVPYEAKVAARQDARVNFAEGYSAEQAAAAAQREKDRQALYLELQSGAAGHAELEQAKADGIFTKADQINKAEGYIEAREKAVKDQVTFMDWVLSGQPIDPNSKDDRDMLNAAFGAEGEAALRAGNEEYLNTVLAPVVAQAQDIPTDAVGTLKGMSRSKDMKTRIFALQAMSELNEQSPDAVNSRFDDRTVADMVFYNARKDIYTESELFELLQEDPNRSGLVAELRKDAGRMFASTDSPVNGSRIIDEFKFSHKRGLFGIGGVPELPESVTTRKGMEMDAYHIFQDEYARDGDADRAMKATVELLNRQWQPTEIGGKLRFMKLPPRAVGYKPIQGSYDWIDRQVRSDLEVADDTPFELIADDQTRAEFIQWQSGAEGTEPPSYQVVWFDEDGPHLKVDENGTPERIYFVPGEKETQLDSLAFDLKNAQDNLQQFVTGKFNPAFGSGTFINGDIQRDLFNEKAQLEYQVQLAEEALNAAKEE